MERTRTLMFVLLCLGIITFLVALAAPVKMTATIRIVLGVGGVMVAILATFVETHLPIRGRANTASQTGK